MKFVGLTDNPERKKQEHGNPTDFTVEREFASEAAARQWERQMLAQGHEGDTGGAGWRYGYTF